MLSSLGCCFWWFLAGALLGWLLNRWLCKCCCKTPPSSGHTTTYNTSAVAKAADVPAGTVAPKAPEPVAAVAPTPAPAPAPSKPKAPAKPKAAAKPKAPAKPKAAAKTPAIDIAAAKAAGFVLKNANDLTVVEGIGPKINELFNDNGIKTFAQLAKATVPQMRAILDKGGSRFRIANPSTWAQQGALAAANKWTELKKLQDDLSAGVKK